MTHTFTLQQKSHLFNQKEYDMVLYVLFYRVIIDIGRFKTIRCFMPKILIMELEISYLSVQFCRSVVISGQRVTDLLFHIQGVAKG